MDQPSPTPSTYGGTDPSPTSTYLSGVSPVISPIVHQWLRLASPGLRPQDFLSLLSFLVEGPNRSLTTKLQGNNAKTTLNAIDKVFLDGKIPGRYERDVLSVMRALAHNSGEVPLRYQVEPGSLHVEDDVIATGAFSDIRKGRLGNRTVAVKTLRTCWRVKQDARKRFCKECIIWMSVSHPYLLQLIAVDINPLTGKCSMISEMMLNGNIKDYIKGNPPKSDRLRLLYEAAMGLHHLHERGIVHGDLKGHSILISNQMPSRACLADFGLSTLAPGTLGQISMTTNGGTPSYMAPELFDPTKFGKTGADRHGLRISTLSAW